MRKILLGSTAVVGLALTGAAAQAQTAPTVRIGGFMEVAGAYAAGDDADKAVPGVRRARQKFDFRNESEVHVFVTGKAANGLAYGATIELQMDNLGGSGAGTGVDTDEGYLWVSSPVFGNVRLGDEDSAASLMQVRVPTITGMGPDGNWDELTTNRSSTSNPWSYTLSGINDGNDSTKLIYLSPQFYGFDFGASYAPNSGEGERVWQGASSTVSQRDYTTLTNEVSLAARYRGSFAGVGVAAGFGMQMAGPPKATQAPSNLQDIRVYTVGLNLSYVGFTVGGEYTWGQYSGTSQRTALPRGASDSHHYVVGVTYTLAALSLGAYVGQAEQDKLTVRSGVFGHDRKQTVWGIGTSYNLAPGLDLIASYNNGRDKYGPDMSTSTSPASPGPTGRNLQVIYAGARLAF
ncbi:porin [Acetobacteraceae bacterium H6797]|nr:porin [Acetobacteraceae bacterium H6797]